MIDTRETIRRILLEIPAAVRVFQKYDFEYLQSLDLALEAACRARGLPLQTIQQELEAIHDVCFACNRNQSR